MTKPLTAFFIAAGLVGLTLASLPSARLIGGEGMAGTAIQTSAPGHAGTLTRRGTR